MKKIIAALAALFAALAFTVAVATAGAGRRTAGPAGANARASPGDGARVCFAVYSRRQPGNDLKVNVYL